LEIMLILQEHNNFNGVLAITSVFNSSAVHRIVTTKEKLPSHLLKALEDATALIADHFKLYLEKLRSINPPCVPFFGQYQTSLWFLEEGNPDFLHNSQLINFSKRRKVAEIISEIQQYQNQPYCLSIYPKLRTWLENLEPLWGDDMEQPMTDKEFTDHLWQRSIEIEPRANDTLKKRPSERRWPGLKLTSPGIKPKTLPGKNHPNPLPKILSGSGSRASEEDSPLPSPSFGSPVQVFRQSPVSTPVTPGYQTGSPREELYREEPVKMTVILPCPPSSSMPAPPTSKPPPLPPKPRQGTVVSAPDLPPLPPRDSSPPPPLPPRLPPARPVPAQGRSPALESRPPHMDPVFPKRNSIMDNSPLPPAIAPRARQLPSEPSPSSRWDPHHSLPPASSPHHSSLTSSPLTRYLPPPHLPSSNTGSAPGSASWGTDIRTLPHSNGPSSAGPEMGSHFTFGNHLSGRGAPVDATLPRAYMSEQGPPQGRSFCPEGGPQLPPRPPPYRHHSVSSGGNIPSPR
jgi:son of sevenless-like protein